MIIDFAKDKLKALADEHGSTGELVTITCKALSPEEAIGNPLHDDYPIQLGKERLIEAEFLGKKGQAFSDAYLNYTGSVREILSLRLDTNARRAIFISSLNAIMAGIGKMPEALHCKNDDLIRCGRSFANFIAALPATVRKTLLVGLQPRLLEALASSRQVRVCDLNPDNIGTKKCGVTIDGPERFVENARWADAVFATGSTVVNGTIDAIAEARPDTVFYGVTIAGVARLAGLRQFCYITGATHDATGPDGDEEKQGLRRLVEAGIA
ncbi:MAG: DUF364 domain-containing protein [Pseudomonadota bacterium]|nr:DUF364 domain-containing protein [Pseudomonadota bacterium]